MDEMQNHSLYLKKTNLEEDLNVNSPPKNENQRILWNQCNCLCFDLFPPSCISLLWRWFWIQSLKAFLQLRGRDIFVVVSVELVEDLLHFLIHSVVFFFFVKTRDIMKISVSIATWVLDFGFDSYCAIYFHVFYVSMHCQE